MENTLSNKSKFFALYWEQKVLKMSSLNKLTEVNGYWIYESLERKQAYLELKSLSSITDEDTIELAKIIYGESYVENENNISHFLQISRTHDLVNELDKANIPMTKASKIVDFLRSRGYALPWIGISVEQQIEWSWVVI